MGELEQKEKELNELERKARQIRSRKIPQRRFGVGVTRAEQKQVLEARREASDILRRIPQARKDVAEARRLSAEQKDRESRAAQLEKGRRAAELTVFDRKRGAYAVFGLKTPLEKQAFKEYVRVYKGEAKFYEAQSKLSAEGIRPIYDGGRLVGLEDTKRGQSIPVSSISSLDKKTLQRYEKAGLISTTTSTKISVTPREKVLNQSLTISERNKPFFQPLNPRERPKTTAQKVVERYNTANAFLVQRGTKPIGSFISRTSGITISKLENVQPKYDTRQARFGRAVTISLIKDVRDKPLKNVVLLGIGGGIGVATRFIGKGSAVVGGTKAGQILKKVNPLTKAQLRGVGIGAGVAVTSTYSASVLKDLRGKSSDEIAGKIAVEVKDLALLGVGTRAGIKAYDVGSDLRRTFGSARVATEDIVAPEFFKGQKYPKIRGGQTAGQLKQEFYNPVTAIREQAGIPRMFTASPATFKKTTTAGAGSSELPGLYGAPRLSATFLKVQSERKFKPFGFTGIFATSEPTALRTELSGLGFVPGTRGRQRNLRPLDNQLRMFFKDQAELGKAYIPFIKTEKEAILTAGSEIKVYQSKYFFKFKGRRVPIFEAKTTGEAGVKEIGKVDDFIKKYYSYGSKSRTPLISPLSLSTSSSRKLFSSKALKSSGLASSSKYGVSSKASYKNSYNPSRISSPPSYPSPPSSPSYSPPSRPPSSPPYSPPGSPPSRPPKPPRSPPIIPKLPKLKTLSQKRGVQGYRPFVIKGGKKVYLSTALPKGSALRRAETEAKKTLRATFGVEKTAKIVKGSDINYTPNKNLFRDYRIKGGKKLKLENTFIQRKGKRLAFKGETAEIQRARRIAA